MHGVHATSCSGTRATPCARLHACGKALCLAGREALHQVRASLSHLLLLLVHLLLLVLLLLLVHLLLLVLLLLLLMPLHPQMPLPVRPGRQGLHCWPR